MSLSPMEMPAVSRCRARTHERMKPLTLRSERSSFISPGTPPLEDRESPHKPCTLCRRIHLVFSLGRMIIAQFSEKSGDEVPISYLFSRKEVIVAESGGFEPPVELLVLQRFSKPPPSATRPTLQPTAATQTAAPRFPDYTCLPAPAQTHPRICSGSG
jgi:hypothetical protein